MNMKVTRLCPEGRQSEGNRIIETRILRFLICLFLCFFFASPSFSADLTLEQLIEKVQSNQSGIKNMYAETTTTITSNIAMPGSKDKGPQKMVQKGKMWSKGQDKSKIEMLSPTKQITITNGDRMAIINPATGQKIIKQLNKTQLNNDVGRMSLEKAKEYFDLKVTRLRPEGRQFEGNQQPGTRGEYVIIGVPKDENRFLGKMEFYIDDERWVPVKIMMYSPNGRLMSDSNIEYQEISGVWVPRANSSVVNTPMGKMEIKMIYENVKVNGGMDDREFVIE